MHRALQNTTSSLAKHVSSVQYAVAPFPAQRLSSRTSSSVPSANAEPSVSGRSTSPIQWLWIPLSAAVGIAGTAFAVQEQGRSAWNAPQNQTLYPTCLSKTWVQQLVSESENKMVLSAETMHKHPLLKRDHMFSELLRHKMVEDLICFYNKPERSLKYVIQLGKIMHGGLTAAILDESFGFLWLSLRSNSQLPFRGPAFTAHLEVDYKQKIPAGSLLLCKTEVESCVGRKLWMKATVTDGPSGKEYATARALFVCPKTQKLIQEGVRYVYSMFK